MKSLGLRCSNNDFAYAIVVGTKKAPILKKFDLVSYPKGYLKPKKLKWFYQELQEISRNQNIDKWTLKGAEPMAQRGKAFVERVEFEGVATLAASEASIAKVNRKVKPTIAKDLGLRGRAKSLVEDLDDSLIPDLKGQSDKVREAILVAWSELD